MDNEEKEEEEEEEEEDVDAGELEEEDAEEEYPYTAGHTVPAPARSHTEKAPDFLTFLQEQCGSHCFEAIGLAVDRFAQLRTTVTSFQNFGEVHFFFSLFSSFDEVQ